MNLRLLPVLLLLACDRPAASGPNEVPASSGTAPGPSGVATVSSAAVGVSPDARSLAALAGQIDVGCADTCCVPKLDWIGEWGPPPSPDELRAARSALTTATDAPTVTLGLRVVSHSDATSDVPMLTRYVDDERAGVPLPSVRPAQQVRRCDPVTWSPSTPSKEALRALGALYGQTFSTPASYHAWAAANPDPEASFAVWNARLGRQEPPPPQVVAALRAKSALLFVRVMASRCNGDDRCGVAPADLAQAIKVTLGPARALAWLDGSEKLPESEVGSSYANVLRSGEVVFSRAEVPALERLWSGGVLGDGMDRGMLAVLLSRLDPPNAKKYWRKELARAASAAAGVAVVLQEAARRDAPGMEPELRSGLVSTGNASEDDQRARALFSGLAAAEPRAAPVFVRLVRAPFPTTSSQTLGALWDAAMHFGCAGLGPRDALEYRALKNQSKADADRERGRSEAAQRSFLSAARACAKR